jgi:hypothetical protein
MFAVLCAHIAAGQHPACALVAGSAGLVTFIAGGPVLVFGTAVQVLRAYELVLWKEVAIAQSLVCPF